MRGLTKTDRQRLGNDARKRIKTRKGKRKTLARLYDELILATLSIFDTYDKSRHFYDRGAHVDYNTLVSVAMDNREPNDVLQLWQALVHTPLKDRAACPPTAEQRTALVDATQALETLLYRISGENEERRYDYVSSEWWTEKGNYMFYWQFWDLLRLTTLVNMREVDIFFKHHEAWRQEWEENGLPVVFLFDGSIQEYSKMWESVKEKFRTCNPTFVFGMCDHYLPLEIADYPQAFCFGKAGRHPLHRLGHITARALQIEHELKLDYDNETMTWTPNQTLERAAFNVSWAVIDYFRRARAMCKPTSSTHRKWLEAEANLIAHCGADADPITPEVAGHIIALANDAAREQWIESRTGSNSSAKDAITDKLLASMVQVHLDDAQLHELTHSSAKTGARIERKLVTVQKTVNGEHIKVNEKSRANTKRVKDALSRYYKLVKDGTKERMATTDACRETEAKMGLGDYKSFNAFRGAVAREIAERKRRYGDRAASVSLDE